VPETAPAPPVTPPAPPVTPPAPPVAAPAPPVTPVTEVPPGDTPVPPVADLGPGVSVPTVVMGNGMTAVADRVATGEAAGAPGVPGTSINGNSLVFLHGRSQQGKDPQALRRSWTGGLNRGLSLAGLAPVDVSTAWYPFYGDVLNAVTQAQEAVALPALPAEAFAGERIDVAEALAPATSSTRDVYEELIAEAARDAGMPEAAETARPEEGLFGSGIISKLQRQLDWLAGRSGLDDVVIALFFRDVAAYLDRPGVRTAVLDAVRQTLPSTGRVVLVTHSLGTVVGMDLLGDLDPALDVAMLVTAGSPLGMDSVFRRLLSGGPNRPARVRRWVNAFCAPDPVAIGCPLADDWSGQIEEVVTNNPKERAHSIEEYLADARVARRISESLLAPVIS
jgi:endonuclease G